MPYFLDDLIVDRVDFVDEGANSAAFIELFKRKERGEPMEFNEILSKLKPEHASVVEQTLRESEEQVAKLRGDLEAANNRVTDLEGKLDEANQALAKSNPNPENAPAVPEESDTAEKSTSFDETEVLKSMPEAIREEFLKMRAQKEAAEEQVRKAAAEKLEAEAVAKAATLKALPVEQSVLVEVLKGGDQRVIDILTSVAAAIDGTVLNEVGKSAPHAATVEDDAWAKIEAEADKVSKRDSITKQKAIAVVIKEQPELYREYLNGGAK